MILTQKSDSLGALASALCLVHCLATPLIFVAQSCSLTCCSASPTWWQFIDYFFVVISFLAIFRSVKTTTSTWIKPALWISWSLLVLCIVNEKMNWFYLNDNLVYVPALLLVGLHLYNKKYCQCDGATCCSH